MTISESNFKILVVDDTQANVLLIKAILSKMQYNVVVAYNGEEALTQIEVENPDLILLDVMMPGINGFEVSKRVRANPLSAHIPIIFLTALSDVENIVTGFEAGGSDYISKPFKKEELLARVRHQIQLVDAQRLIQQKTIELEQTIKGRDRLYSVVAHDLRSPIGSIKMILNMLMLTLDKSSVGGEQMELINVANKTAEGIFFLLDNLLKWTKSQLGRLNVVFQEINISEVGEGVIELFDPLASLKNIKIHFKGDPDTNVYADSDMLKTVFRNLLSNAIKFTPEEGQIFVSIYSTDDIVVAEVRDTGCGISLENKEKLLKADTHYSSFGTNNEEGSGLGLLLVEDFVRKNNGQFWFESELNVGSTFFFSFPKLQAPQ